MMTPRQNPYTEQHVEKLLQHLEQHPTAGWYAMMDHLMQADLLQRLGQHKRHVINLYGDACPLSSAASPVLLPLPMKGSALQTLLAQLLLACTGRPMLSFWASPLPVSQLVSHFAHYQDVSLQPDNTVMLLRYADTRVLPSLLRQLSPVQRQEWLAPFTQILSFDAEAVMHLTTGSQLGRIGQGKLSLKPEQWEHMLDDALPDCLFDDIAGQLPAALPATIYSVIRQRLAAARQAGCQDDSSLIDYCLQHD